MLPKSLHTVRVLVNVARVLPECADKVRAACDAARVLGYADASSDDPLIQSAARQLAGEPVRRKVSP